MQVPYHRASLAQEEIDEVVECIKSGWLTTGPRTKRFEAEFAVYAGAKHAIAVNSATAALHLALEAVGLLRGEAVLVPTMTFAATAEVVRYFDARPILVDCRDDDLNLDISDLRRRADQALQRGERLRAVIPVHYGGQVADVAGIQAVAKDLGLKIIDDAAHCCPAHFRETASAAWKHVGAGSSVSCYSFYANKCITTGEGGMACTDDDAIADRIRIMSLHGISKDAWMRFTAQGSWSYEIIAPGFKYNATDVASAMGFQQLRKADRFRANRARVAARYCELLGEIEELILPCEHENRIHSWHLFVVRLRLERLTIDRGCVIAALKDAGVGTSVHWIPLHLHPYYKTMYGYRPEDFPTALRLSQEIISLPIFPDMQEAEIAYVAQSLITVVRRHRR